MLLCIFLINFLISLFLCGTHYQKELLHIYTPIMRTKIKQINKNLENCLETFFEFGNRSKRGVCNFIAPFLWWFSAQNFFKNALDSELCISNIAYSRAIYNSIRFIIIDRCLTHCCYMPLNSWCLSKHMTHEQQKRQKYER